MEKKYYLFLLQVIAFLFHYADFGHARISTRGDLPMAYSTSKLMPCHNALLSKTVSCSERNLESVPENLPTDILSLDLSRNNVKSLNRYSFWRYSLLEELDLSYNNITFIASLSFYPLKRLKIINLSGNNNLRNIQSELFQSCVDLSHLDLENCGIDTFPNDAFQWVPNLQKLILRGNPINSFNISSCPKKNMDLMDLTHTLFEEMACETFVFPCNCSKLRISFKNLHAADPRVIASLRVRELFLDVKALTYNLSNVMQIYKDLFKGIAESGLDSFSITNFDIRASHSLTELSNKRLAKLTFLQFSHFDPFIDISWPIFSGLSHVHTLDIFNSTISWIRNYYFAGMNKLVNLDLSYNSIYVIEDAFAWGCFNLNSLNLSFNMLMSIEINTFYGLDELVSLDLSGNPGLYVLSLSLPKLRYLNVSNTEVGESHVFDVPSLIVFDFSGNLGDSLLTGSFFYALSRFKQSSSLQVVNLSNSRLTLTKLINVRRGISLFWGLKNLTYLELYDNELDVLVAGLFPQLSILKRLILSKCKIRNVDPNVFADLHSLSTLDLSDNNIASLPGTLLTASTSLQYLFIQENILTHLGDSLFATTSNLTYLRLDRNQFTTMNISTFDSIMSSLRSIDLSANPLECSCDLKWLVEWLRGSEGIFLPEEATCSQALENNFRGKPLISLHPDEICASNIALYFTIPCIGILIMIVSAISFHNRWVLKYKFYVLKLSVLGYREMKDLRSRDDFEYDLNIIFTGIDELWAAEFFKPNLAERLPQFHRVAFGDNDLPLGMWELDAVHYLIEQSSNTIILLSRAAIQDNDFMLKLRIALNHMTNVNIKSTVLVFLEDIPDEETPYLVKSCLSEKMFHIEWVESLEGQWYFWKQLVKMLKVDVQGTQ